MQGFFLTRNSDLCYNQCMKTLNFTIELPRRRRRAVELYGRDTPFRPKQERLRTAYNRKVKHPQRHEN